MRNLSLPESEATAVQSKGGPGRPSEASREAAALDGNRRAKQCRFAGASTRGSYRLRRSAAGLRSPE